MHEIVNDEKFHSIQFETHFPNGAMMNKWRRVKNGIHIYAIKNDIQHFGTLKICFCRMYFGGNDFSFVKKNGHLLQNIKNKTGCSTTGFSLRQKKWILQFFDVIGTVNLNVHLLKINMIKQMEIERILCHVKNIECHVYTYVCVRVCAGSALYLLSDCQITRLFILKEWFFWLPSRVTKLFL